MKKDIKLYNMILPPFLILTFTPWLVAITLIGNFIIDSIVLIIISFIVFKRFNKSFYLNRIWRVVLFGYAGDLVGAAFLIFNDMYFNFFRTAFCLLTGYWYSSPIVDGVYSITNSAGNLNTYSYIYLGFAVLVAAIALFFFNYLFTFRKSELTKKQKIIASLMFAVLTAPYTFFLPNSMFYHY